MNITTVDLRVVGLDLDSPETGEILGTKFSAAVWEERDNLVIMTVSVPAENVMEQVVNMCRRLETLVRGAKVEGVDRDLVNSTDIAQRVDLTREAVRKWTTRDDFPQPQAVVGKDSMKIWAWTQVVEWLNSVRGIDMGDSPLSVQQMTHLENCIMRNPDHTTTQWHKTSKAGPVFQSTRPVQPAQVRVVIDAASGRGQSETETLRLALGTASSQAS